MVHEEINCVTWAFGWNIFVTLRQRALSAISSHDERSPTKHRRGIND